MADTHLVSCATCSRHHFAHEAACPFCAKTVPPVLRSTRLAKAMMAAVTPMVLAACYGVGKFDSGGGGLDSGDGLDSGPGGALGDLDAFGVVTIVEASCNISWDITGPETSCSGCDIAFDATLALDPGNTTCDFGDDSSGTLEFANGYTYFGDDYWGAGYVGGGTVAWASYAYVYGAGGYTYLYSGGGTY